jgi:hypothetical protein
MQSHRAPRQHFTEAEDESLRALVTALGEGAWAAVASEMPRRTRRQCSERWKHYLSPTITRAEWTMNEDALLIEKVKQHGQQWKLLENWFEGRKDNQLKHRYRLLMRHADKMRTQVSSSNSTSNTPLCLSPVIDDDPDVGYESSDQQPWIGDS